MISPATEWMVFVFLPPLIGGKHPMKFMSEFYHHHHFGRFWCRIGLRENLQETIDFPMKYGAFRLKCSLKPIQWFWCRLLVQNFRNHPQLRKKRPLKLWPISSKEESTNTAPGSPKMWATNVGGCRWLLLQQREFSEKYGEKNGDIIWYGDYIFIWYNRIWL